MKYLLILLLPFTAFGQRAIGLKTGDTYKFDWDMNLVVQKTFDDLNAPFTVDTTYAMNDSAMQVVFTDGTEIYSNVFRYDVINDTIYTASRAAGCYNSCRKEQDCTRCAKAADCTCSCLQGYGSCSEKNEAVFQNITISNWIKMRILTNTNPEE
jgi:hypothetical protein